MSALIDLPQHLPASIDSDQSQRLFHGRGHAFAGLSHVTVDWLAPVVMITLFAPESPTDIELLSEQLRARVPGCASVQLQHRYLKEGPVDVIWGQKITELIVHENGLKFHLNLGRSRNHGLFLDMKEGRGWVRQNSQRRRIPMGWPSRS